ncbi:taste receptor type 2 member 40-like [Triplophysa rosa]|uniref:Taste receptor type 2 n=1 Tax=Triplophysa rosa TaxID=992332 RepID=A0A9W7TFG8_TRIRA|nr:taste receptor type 2 member 40-like [Triplophysa rosa]KAI7797710.1 taste receptor [Triplophysa rosa]
MTVAEHILVLVVLAFVGVSGNMFNLIFTIQQHLKSKNIQTVGLILSIISVNNIVLVIVVLMLVLSVFIVPTIWCIRPYPFFLRTVIYLMLNCSCISFWSIAWQSLFYCVKVVNFSSECLISLKRNISTIINTAVLLSCSGFSVFFSPIFTLDLPAIDTSNVSTNYSLNATLNATCPNPTFFVKIDKMAYAAASLFILCPIPLMIMLPTSLRMVVHLCAHTLALRKNQTQVQGSDSYVLVCKLTISLVGVYLTTLFIVSLFMIIRFMEGTITYLTLAFAFSFYGGMSSVILTASNRHLKEKLWMFCCRKAQEPTTKSQTCETVDG